MPSKASFLELLKRGLWTALAAAAETMPSLSELDYALLEKRATEQCDSVEAKRLEIAVSFATKRLMSMESS
jgi:hypothetical protein